MVGPDESRTALDCEEFFIIIPSIKSNANLDYIECYAQYNPKGVPNSYTYNSQDNIYIENDELFGLVDDYIKEH